MAGYAPAPLPSLSLVLGERLVVAADQGSYSVSGQDAALLVARILAAAQGSYSVSGQDAGLSTGVGMAPAPLPSLGLLGGFGGNNLSAAQGSYSISGQDATFLIGYRLACNAGFYTLSGQPAILSSSVNQGGDPAPLPSIGLVLQRTTTNVTLTADTGIYTIVGSDGLADYEVAAAQGSYSVTGQDADLRKTSVLVAESGTYQITGQDANFSIGSPSRTLTAEQGSYAITGNDAGLYAGRQVSAEQGFFALQGQAANLIYGVANNYSMLAESGSYQLTGQDAALTFGGYVVQADYGVYEMRLQGLQEYPVRTRRAAAPPRRRNYIYKGRRYTNITNEELLALIRKDLVDITREDLKVSYKNKKPHVVSKTAWEEFKADIERLGEQPAEQFDDDEDIEAIIALL